MSRYDRIGRRIVRVEDDNEVFDLSADEYIGYALDPLMINQPEDPFVEPPDDPLELSDVEED